MASPLLKITENSDGSEKEQTADEAASRRLANLKPFRKGSSGNPGGRPPLSAEVRLRAQEATPAALDKIVALMDSDDPRIVLMACKEILDRAFGKVGQADKDDDREQQVTIQLVQFGEGTTPCN